MSMACGSLRPKVTDTQKITFTGVRARGCLTSTVVCEITFQFAPSLSHLARVNAPGEEQNHPVEDNEIARDISAEISDDLDADLIE